MDTAVHMRGSHLHIVPTGPFCIDLYKINPISIAIYACVCVSQRTRHARNRIHNFPRTDREPSVTLGTHAAFFMASSVSTPAERAVFWAVMSCNTALLSTGYLLALLCYPQDGGSMFLRNFWELLPDWTGSHPTRSYC
jgi:hypothetical protein